MTAATIDPASATQDWVAGPVTVTLNSYDTECVPTMAYRLNGGTWVRCTSNPFTFTISQDGDTLLEYYAWDLSANTEQIKSAHLKISGEAPKVTSDATASPYVGSATIHLSASDGGSGIATFEAKLDDEATQTVAGSALTVSTTSPGVHRVRYYARNTTGKTATGEFTFVVNDIPRSVSLTASTKELTYPTIVELVATATNPETTTARFERRRVDRQNWEVLGTSPSTTTGQFVWLDVPAYGYAYRAIVGSIVSDEFAVITHVPLSKPALNTSRVKAGGVLALSGTIRPKHGAATEEIKYRLYWQRYDAKTRKWVAAGTTNMSIDPANDLNSDTSKWMFNRKTAPWMVGAWRVRFFHQCPRHKDSYSPWTTLWVTK